MMALFIMSIVFILSNVFRLSRARGLMLLAQVGRRVRGSLFLCFALVSACGAGAKNETPMAVPESEPTPRVITDLSQIAPAGETQTPPVGASPVAPTTAASSWSASENYQDLRRVFVENPGTTRFVGSAAEPARITLLNAKAAQFPQFSQTILIRLYVATRNLEHGDISLHKLENLKPIVITAVMSKEGRPRELVLEEHSGMGAVDKLMIEACKRGLWSPNTPAEIVGADGTYRLKIEARLKSFNNADGVHWNFETNLGLALL